MTLAQTFEAWTGVPAARLAGWDLVPYERSGRVVALAALAGPEIHFAIAPEWRGRTIFRGATRAFLAPLVARRGYLTTRALAGEGHKRFLTRLGFRHTGTREGVEHYMLSGLPFGKEN